MIYRQFRVAKATRNATHYILNSVKVWIMVCREPEDKIRKKACIICPAWLENSRIIEWQLRNWCPWSISEFAEILVRILLSELIVVIAVRKVLPGIN